MSRVLYLDCFSGIAGDMVLGAFLDAGLPFESLKAALDSLGLGGYEIASERVTRAGIAATKFRVEEHGSAEAGQNKQEPEQGHSYNFEHSLHHRTVGEILALIGRSTLSAAGRDRATGLVRRLAEAEARVHHTPIEQVHVHEVGALDTIIDIVGAVVAMEWAAVDEVVCSPLNVGGGMVETVRGVFPVPSPVTVALLSGAPIYSGPLQKELVTPTGALIATSYAGSFGPVPAMTIDRSGYGAGTRDPKGTPNVLRILMGERGAAPPPRSTYSTDRRE